MVSIKALLAGNIVRHWLGVQNWRVFATDSWRVFATEY